MPGLLKRMTSVKVTFQNKKRPEPAPPVHIDYRTMFDPFFFNDKRCQHRALFMAARLKGALGHGSVDSFWRIVTHRLYTLNYIVFMLPSQTRIDTHKTGGFEAEFAVRYALDLKRRNRKKTLLEDAFEAEKRNGGSAVLSPTDEYVEQARRVIEQCLVDESRLDSTGKDNMYLLYSRQEGLLDNFQVRIELEEDRDLRHRLKRLVQEQNDTQNPFEDDDLVVLENYSTKRKVDSGFYDDWQSTMSV
jgi:hypothetical protein